MIPTIEPVDRAGDDGAEELLAVGVPVDFGDVLVPFDVSISSVLDDGPPPLIAEFADDEVAVDGVKSAGLHRISIG
jgi:hypothetical protein